MVLESSLRTRGDPGPRRGPSPLQYRREGPVELGTATTERPRSGSRSHRGEFRVLRTVRVQTAGPSEEKGSEGRLDPVDNRRNFQNLN